MLNQKSLRHNGERRKLRQKVSWLRKLAVKAAIKRREDSQEFAGVRLRKLPGDCFAMLRLLHICKPQVLVEMGSQYGGSALMFASWAEHLGLEQIISVDIADLPRPQHPLITFVVGDSSLPETVAKVFSLAGKRRGSLVLDSNHHAPHVRKELALYQELISPGQALIVEDTLVDVLHFKKFAQEGGPLRALEDFLEEHPEFVPAEGVEPYVTTNFFGYLVRR